MKIMKNILLGFFVVLMIPLFPLSSSAHTNSQSPYLSNYNCPRCGETYLGGDDVGWGIDETMHTSGTCITYCFDETDPYLSTTYRNLVRSAESLWANSIQIDYDANSIGKIKTSYDSSSTAILLFTGNSTPSTGHIIHWTISINRAKSDFVNLITIAHEFGHVIGLVDLCYTPTSIMYYQYPSSATAVTELDHWGAKVITGVHTSHTWSTRFWKITSGGNMHTTYCTVCNGNGKTTGYCIYGINNRCTVCNHAKPPSLQSIPLEFN